MPLRVIAGAARGRELKQPRGSTRPTAARLREALFSMLDAGGMLRSPAIDLYAGSGALGIEALSRGVERCTFVEADRRACAIVAENVDRVALENYWDRTGTVPLARADQIELQHHGSQLFFKNIYIRELPY